MILSTDSPFWLLNWSIRILGQADCRSQIWTVTGIWGLIQCYHMHLFCKWPLKLNDYTEGMSLRITFYMILFVQFSYVIYFKKARSVVLSYPRHYYNMPVLKHLWVMPQTQYKWTGHFIQNRS